METRFDKGGFTFYRKNNPSSDWGPVPSLRQLGNIYFISHSGVLRLDLDYLLERL
jgi:hypothetical protein